MRTARWCRRASWPLIVLVGGGIAPAADDKAGMPALTGRGLTKQGSVYVLVDDEKPVLAKLREARAASQALAARTDERARRQQVATQIEDLEQQRSMLQLQMDGLTSQMAMQSSGPAQGGMGGAGGGMGGTGGGGMGGPGGSRGGSTQGGGGGGFGSGGQSPASSGLIMQREQLRQQLLQVMSEQRMLKSESASTKDDATRDDRAQQAESTFRTALADLRRQVDAVLKKYADLEADTEVKDALAQARKSNGRVKLGPSDAFVAATRELAKAERQYLDRKSTAATTTTRKKGSAKAKK